MSERFQFQLPKTDIEESNAKKEEHAHAHERAHALRINFTIDALEEILNSFSDSVDHVEQYQMLGPAIERFAHDLADSVHELSQGLRNQSEEDRFSLAHAFLEDAKQALVLVEENSESSERREDEFTFTANRNANRNDDVVDNRENDIMGAQAMSKLSEKDIVDALSGVETVLSDVEVALRSIGQDEAQELADAGLIVARIFLFALQSFHQTLRRDSQSSVVIEEITPENTHENNVHVQQLYQNENEKTSNTTSQSLSSRMRVLWPPIGPAVAHVAHWSTDAAKQQPLLSIALGMVLWPTAVITAFVGFPILALDHALQSGYNALSDKNAPILVRVEQGMSNLFQVGNLYYLCAKLVLKQGSIVGKRQLQRRGGIQQVTQDVGGFVIERAQHPIETAGMVVNGVTTVVRALISFGSFVKDVALGDTSI